MIKSKKFINKKCRPWRTLFRDIVKFSIWHTSYWPFTFAFGQYFYRFSYKSVLSYSGIVYTLRTVNVIYITLVVLTGWANRRQLGRDSAGNGAATAVAATPAVATTAAGPTAAGAAATAAIGNLLFCFPLLTLGNVLSLRPPVHFSIIVFLLYFFQNQPNYGQGLTSSGGPYQVRPWLNVPMQQSRFRGPPSCIYVPAAARTPIVPVPAVVGPPFLPPQPLGPRTFPPQEHHLLAPHPYNAVSVDELERKRERRREKNRRYRAAITELKAWDAELFAAGYNMPMSRLRQEPYEQ